MRHHSDKLIQLATGQYQTRSNVLRTMLTNLVTSGYIVTTPKRAKVLKAYADHFFARLVKLHAERPEDAAREGIRYVKSIIWTKDAGQKVIADLVPAYIGQSRTSGYIANYKLGFRK
jgi:ribosomal protein L17